MMIDDLAFLKSVGLTAGVFLIFAIGSFFVWRHINRKLILWSQKTESDFDDKLIASLQTPLKLIVLSFSLGASLRISPIEHEIQEALILTVKIMAILSMFWSASRALTAFIHSDRVPSTLSDSSRILIKTISKGIVYSIGLLIVLDTLGISITPLLASLGVGSVAVALAAQETLSNLFSGFYILLDRPFRIGDCIKLDGGVEGFVTKIGWRSTHIRLFANNVAVLPNSKIAGSIITNYDFPESDTTVVVPVSTAYESDLKFVEQVVLEVAFLVQNTSPIGSKLAPPTMVFTQFADFGINFNVVLRVQKYTDSNLMKHEFIKALHARFNQEGISIPYPQQVIQLAGKSLPQ